MCLYNFNIYRSTDCNINKSHDAYSCFWNIETTPQYRQSQDVYYFVLTAHNKLGELKQNFTFKHYQNGK